jgi:hypothetical protein
MVARSNMKNRVFSAESKGYRHDRRREDVFSKDFVLYTDSAVDDLLFSGEFEWTPKCR